MRFFQTDESGFLVGQGVADVSPLEPEILDENGGILSAAVYLIPRGGVTVPPPVLGKNECARWVSGAWVVAPDFMGQTYFLPDHSRHVIETRGIPLPVGALPADPPKTKAEMDAEASAKAHADLLALDMDSIREMRAYIAAKADAPKSLKDKEELAVAAIAASSKVGP